jgi:hypothetical protein
MYVPSRWWNVSTQENDQVFGSALMMNTPPLRLQVPTFHLTPVSLSSIPIPWNWVLRGLQSLLVFNPVIK